MKNTGRGKAIGYISGAFDAESAAMLTQLARDRKQSLSSCLVDCVNFTYYAAGYPGVLGLTLAEGEELRKVASRARKTPGQLVRELALFIIAASKPSAAPAEVKKRRVA